MRLLLAFLLFMPQDPANLLEQLRDDDIEVRHAAFAKLVELGPSILPSLQNVDSTDPEFLTAVANIATKIQRNEKIKTFFNPSPRITHEFVDKPANEVAAYITKSSGIPLNVWGGEREISVKFNNATPIQAADQLARALGMRHVFRNEELSILDDDTKDGHFNFHVDGVSLQLLELNISRRLITKLSGLVLVAEIQVDPRIKPSMMPEVTISSIMDETGRKLQNAVNAYHRGSTVPTTIVQGEGLVRSAKKLFVEGTVELNFALNSQSVTVETPLGEGRTIDGPYFKLEIIDQGAGYAALAVSKKDGRPFNLEKSIISDSIKLKTPQGIVGEDYVMVTNFNRHIRVGIAFESLKFVLVDEYWTKSIPFKLEIDIP